MRTKLKYKNIIIMIIVLIMIIHNCFFTTKSIAGANTHDYFDEAIKLSTDGKEISGKITDDNKIIFLFIYFKEAWKNSLVFDVLCKL